MSTLEWFYIRSTHTGNVVSASTNTAELLRSQVLVTPPTLSDHELWCWKGQFLVNKANDFVLDIRKGKKKRKCRIEKTTSVFNIFMHNLGRLRLIEDTEICLYNQKPVEDAHNQLWGVTDDAVDAYGRPLPGSYIYSLCSNEWVLDVQPTSEGQQKLVLFPLEPMENESQRWLFVPEGELDLAMPIKQVLASTTRKIVSPPVNASYFSTVPAEDMIITPPGSISSSPDFASGTNEGNYPQGLTPAKRGSHSSIFSVETFKEYHNRVYTSQEPNVR